MLMQSHTDVVRDYLKFVGVRPDRPTLSYLTHLIRTFHRLPYENLTKIIRLHEAQTPFSRLRLPCDVLSDHILHGSGGTCFSLTYFFWHVLHGSGFRQYPVFCDRSYGPDTHCALIVILEGNKYLVDTGYLMEQPLLLPSFGEVISRGRNQTTVLWRIAATSQYLLSTVSGKVSKLRYRLKDTAVSHELFIKRWMDSFDWAMMRHPCVSKHTEDGQLFMRDGTMRKVFASSKEQNSIRTGFSAQIKAHFGISESITDNACDALDSVFGRKPV